MNLGLMIKSLRIKKGLTQEQLADYLSVSTQTVSRWETSVNYPDVTMLPVLSNIFDVSTDHLLGVDVLKNKEMIEKILEEVRQLQHIGHLDDAIDILRKGIQQFPNDYSLLLKLSSTLNFYEIKNNDYLEESIAISKKVLETTLDDKFRKRAISNLFFGYIKLEDKKSAREVYDNYIANNITEDYYAHHVLEGEELINNLQNSILRKYHDLWSALMKMRRLDIYTKEEKIKLLDKFNQLTPIFFENNDLGYYNWLIYSININISIYCAELEDKELTLKYIEKSAEHALKFDTRPDELFRSSVLLNKTKDLKKDTINNSKFNTCYEMIENLKHQRFDFVRDENRFYGIVENLQEYAKEL